MPCGVFPKDFRKLLSYFNINPDDEDIVNNLSNYLVMDFDLMKKKIELSLKYIDVVSKHFLPKN